MLLKIIILINFRQQFLPMGGPEDSRFEDDYDYERIKNLTKKVEYFEKFNYHLSTENFIEIIEVYSDLRLNYNLVQKEESKVKQEGYLSNINHAIKRIKEIIPKSIQEKLRLKVGKVEKKIYKEFSDEFPSLFEL
jgi:hypothetical protein